MVGSYDDQIRLSFLVTLQPLVKQLARADQIVFGVDTACRIFGHLVRIVHYVAAEEHEIVFGLDAALGRKQNDVIETFAVAF